MSIPIFSAKDRPLGDSFGNVPQMSDTLLSWFQPMVFTRVVKTVLNANIIETPTTVDTRGVIQPFSARQLMMKDIGQRGWQWHMIHALPDLVLDLDEVVTYKGVQYRIKSQSDYSLYGYVQYEAIEDFTGSGP